MGIAVRHESELDQAAEVAEVFPYADLHLLSILNRSHCRHPEIVLILLFLLLLLLGRTAGLSDQPMALGLRIATAIFAAAPATSVIFVLLRLLTPMR